MVLAAKSSPYSSFSAARLSLQVISWAASGQLSARRRFKDNATTMKTKDISTSEPLPRRFDEGGVACDVVSN